MSNKKVKILIIRLSAIGDTIHTLPLVNALKRDFEDIEIHWIVEDKAQFFVQQAKNVDKYFIIPKKQWKQEKNKLKVLNDFSRLIDKLRREKYDIALDVQQLFKSGLILGLCGAKRKISLSIAREFSQLFANEVIKAKAKLFDSNYHVTKRNQEFLQYLGGSDDKLTFELKDFSQSSQQKAQELLKNIDTSKPTLLFAPATTWFNKHWTVENWQVLYNYFSDKANIVFTGMACDSDLIENITQDNKKCINLVGQTNLEELAQVIKMTDLVVSPDSGTAHIAWAVEKPYVITLFTSTAKNRSCPIGDKCFVFDANLPCQPCLKKKCPLRKDKNKCMSALQPQVIIEKINELLF